MERFKDDDEFKEFLSQINVNKSSTLPSLEHQIQEQAKIIQKSIKNGSQPDEKEVKLADKINEKGKAAKDQQFILKSLTVMSKQNQNNQDKFQGRQKQQEGGGTAFEEETITFDKIQKQIDQNKMVAPLVDAINQEQRHKELKREK